MQQYLIDRANHIRAERRRRLNHALSGFVILAAIILNAYIG